MNCYNFLIRQFKKLIELFFFFFFLLGIKHLKPTLPKKLNLNIGLSYRVKWHAINYTELFAWSECRRKSEDLFFKFPLGLFYLFIPPIGLLNSQWRINIETLFQDKKYLYIYIYICLFARVKFVTNLLRKLYQTKIERKDRKRKSKEKGECKGKANTVINELRVYKTNLFSLRRDGILCIQRATLADFNY